MSSTISLAADARFIQIHDTFLLTTYITLLFIAYISSKITQNTWAAVGRSQQYIDMHRVELVR